jgi:hypothetical protein
MTYREFIEKFPDDESVAKYLIEKRFDGKIVCPFCGKTEKVYHAPIYAPDGIYDIILKRNLIK